MTISDLAIRTSDRLRPDSSRVVARLFVPGQGLLATQESQASRVVERVLALDEDDVKQTLAEVTDRFGSRHRDLVGIFLRHAARVTERVSPKAELSDERKLLLGATFTHEYAVEGAALCNPSLVAHPDQTGTPPGSLRFVMSVRGIGEGHRSSVGFRTGTISLDATISVDAAGPFPEVGTVTAGLHDREVFHGKLHELGVDGESAAFVLDGLGDRFGGDELESGLRRLHSQLDTRQNAGETIERLRAIASCTYASEFAPTTDVSERVLWPAATVESYGIEDARFVRFTDDDGSTVYFATYTAYDGVRIAQQMLETTDFASFTSSPIVGQAAANKGLALFPRRIGGRFAALSRHDQETNAVAFSDNPRSWGTAVSTQVPQQPWETIQLGNCGSPIETEAGWLVLTHGVGPMRTYCIGALLLDLDDPTQVVGRLPRPLLSPVPDEQDGYVPNVVYSCGALVHAGTLVMPYGIADTTIGIATVSLAGLIDAFERDAG